MKKALHHFNRGLVMGLEFCALLAVLVFLLWGALLWRLSMGPLDASFLTGRLEASMNARQPGFSFHIGGTQLVWGGHLDLFQVEMRNVTVRRTDGADVVSMRKVGVHLSKRHLVFGRLTPKLVRIYEPALRVVRWEDGHITLNLDAQPAQVFSPPLPPEVADRNAAEQVAFLQGVLQGLNDHSPLGFLIGGLEEISVRDAHLVYDDRALGLELESSDTDIVFGRTRSGFTAKINMAAALSPDRRMALVIEGRYRRDSGESDITVQFAGVDPSEIAARSDRLAAWRGAALSLTGSLALRLSADFKPARARFILGAEDGTLGGFGLYDASPLPLGRLYAKGSVDFAQQALRIDSFRADLRGPLAEGKAVVQRMEDGRFHLSASAALGGMPMDDLAAYWPETLAPDPRWWVTTHLSRGIATRATLEAGVFFNPAPEDDAAAVEIEKLGGTIDFEGIRVDYLPPLMPVDDVRGQASYDAHQFNLAITGGALGGMKVSKSAIAITGLADEDPESDAEIDIRVSVAGSVATALKVLDSKPLGYTKMLGIDSADVAGRAAVELAFRFPIRRDLDIADVHVTAEAQLEEMRLPAMVSGLAVTGGPMALKVDNGALNVKGNGRLGDMPVTFDWSRNFDRKKPFASSVTAELTLSETARRAFGVPDMAGLHGPLPSRISYRLEQNGRATLDLAADMTPAALAVPDIGFSKTAGTAGSLSLRIFMEEGVPQRIGNIAVETEGLRLRGEADIAGGTFRKAHFPTVAWGQTDAAIDIENRAAAGYVLRISGRQFDAARWVQDDGVPNSDVVAAVRSAPVQVSMDVGRLVVGEGRVLEKARMFMRRNEWKRIEQMEIDGRVGGGDLYLRYMPAAQGPSLRLESADAGAALAFFGVSRSIRGGRLVVRGEPAEKGGARDMRGSVVLSDFVLRDAPALALLLNAMSLAGVLDLLNGEGIAFKRARVNFSWTDRGQPAQQKNVRRIRLRDGRTSGASLGLNFEGEIDNWAKTLDLDGTIIPISGVNNVLSGIPLVGDILTGGGGGILAATYTIRGAIDKPQVSVNPLSVLAPGILRKIFFEN